MKILISLLGLLLFMVPLHAADLASVSGFRVGGLFVPDDATKKGDFVVAVFSDNLMPDPALKDLDVFIPTSKDAPLSGCLSVVRLDLHSGARVFKKNATLTFGCSNVPENSAVMGWINGQWTEIESEISESGRVTAQIRHLTTYAIFPTNSDQESDLLLSQI